MTSLRERVQETDRQAIHFGCWGRVGHFFHDTEGRSLGLSAADLGLPWKEVDGKLTPGRRDRRGRLDYDAMAGSQQGKAALHRKGGWTALAVHDFTVDSRPGSNTVFFFHGELDADEAAFSVVEFFPAIERRMGNIRIVEVHDEPAPSSPDASRDAAPPTNRTIGADS